jgi:uncharacterized protein (TIGR02600 family)
MHSRHPHRHRHTFAAPHLRPEVDGRLSGAALVIVLSFLIIMTGLVVAFLSSVMDEATSTSASVAGVATRRLSEAAIQLDIAQILDATSGCERDNQSGSMNASKPVGWASQPGAIRTWSANPSKTNVYKLYSCAKMVDDGGGNPTNDLPQAGWWKMQALYTDLNSPVVSSAGITNYPIMDPTMTNGSNGVPLVDGFTIDSVSQAVSGSGNPAAMPVLWLYMLRDGTIIQPDPAGGTKATFKNAPVEPSATNPIVGRIAFWTDDETCKLNLNTAAEGSFWGTPHFSTSMDQAFAQFPPGATEFNRFPGHPASTCLSPALWSFMGLDHPGRLVMPMPDNRGSYDIGSQTAAGFNRPYYPSATLTNYLTNLFTNVTPRYAYGGSYGGIRSLVTNTAGTFGAMPTNRLYATVDEFFFAATNVPNSGDRATNATLSTLSASSAAQIVSGLKFFLTTVSRAPEVNPFNLPKITLWPEPDTNNKMTANPFAASGTNSRTPLDQTIAFCSTLGTNAYYFTRYDATRSTTDPNIPRNKTLYAYLRRMLDRPVPGFGGAFTQNKWTAPQANQITAEIYDYIRGSINLCDSYAITNNTLVKSNQLVNSYTAPSSASNGSIAFSPGSGQVVPAVLQNPDGSTSRGMGRIATIRGGTLWFVASAANQPPLMCHPDGRPIVYLANGTQISTAGNPSTIQSTYITNVLAGQAYAMVNPMHPWTTPYSSGVTVGGVSMVPQYLVAGGAVLADTNPSLIVAATNASKPNKVTSNTASVNAVYPVFALSTANGNAGMANPAAGTRTFPSYPSQSSGAGMITYTTNAGFAPVSWYTNASPTNSNAAYMSYVVSLATNGVAIPSLSSGYGHMGLPFLTIQNTNGSFNIPNAAYMVYQSSDQSLPPTPNMATFPPHTTVVETAYLPNLVNVTPGSSGYSPAINVQSIFTAAVTANGTAIFGTGAGSLTNNGFFDNNPPPYYLYDLDLMHLGVSSGRGITNSANFRVTNLPGSTPAFAFGGATVQNVITSTLGSKPTVQTVSLNFPATNFPVPKLPNWVRYDLKTSPRTGFYYPPSTNLAYVGSPASVPWFMNPLGAGLLSFGAAKMNLFGANGEQLSIFPTVVQGGNGASFPGDPAWNRFKSITCDTIQSVELRGGDPRMISCLETVTTNFFAPNPLYGVTSPLSINGWTEYYRSAHSLRQSGQALPGGNYGTLLFTNGTDSYLLPPTCESNVSLYTNLPVPAGVTNSGLSNVFAYSSAPYATFTISPIYQGHGSRPQGGAFATVKDTTFWDAWTKGGDFDNGVAFYPDGPYMGKVDEGFGYTNTNVNSAGISPYYSFYGSIPGRAVFSPNRQVPSPVILGSLPVGITGTGTNILANSWKTLQFSPNPNAPAGTSSPFRSGAGYNAAGGPITNPVVPDHLILDFFHMPVVQPYPISDPFSTAGKVNMNCQIVPFSYINRDTALRGVLKPVLLTAVDARWGYDYKLRSTNLPFGPPSYQDTQTRTPGAPAYTGGSGLESQSGQWYFHYPIHAGETLKQFTARFAKNDIFHSPSEICALWLYPGRQPTSATPLGNTNPLVTWDPNNANITGWWYGSSAGDLKAKSLTGNNLRERPYNYIYPRLTTKSNTYQIHYRVQALQQTPTAHPRSYATWIDPSARGITDKVIGESRGSAMIERFIDPSDKSLPDFAANVSAGGFTGRPLYDFYRCRVFNSKQFTP